MSRTSRTRTFFVRTRIVLARCSRLANTVLDATLDIAMWSTVEGGLGITAASLATLRPLFRLIAPHLGLSTRGPSVLQDSDQPEPRGLVGNSGGSRGRNEYGELFSLTTLKGPSEAGTTIVCQSSSDGAHDRSKETYNSSWVKQEKTNPNESEEELTTTR